MKFGVWQLTFVTPAPPEDGRPGDSRSGKLRRLAPQGETPMGAEITATVWKHSRHRGPELLLMLAIAAGADEQGVAHTKVEDLAKVCRVGVRNAHRILAKLRESGEILTISRTQSGTILQVNVKPRQNPVTKPTLVPAASKPPEQPMPDTVLVRRLPPKPGKPFELINF